MNSKLIMAKEINVDREYNNVLSYSNSDMLELLQSEEHLVGYDNKYSFIKPTNTLLVHFTYAQCLQSNYIAFQNPNYSNKWFFAWIDEVKYISDASVELSYTVDAWTTWYGSWTKKTCYVKRHHVNNDTIGINTVPENLYVNDVIQEAQTIETSYLRGDGIPVYIGMTTSYQIKDGSYSLSDTGSALGSQFDGITVYNEIVYGEQVVLFKIDASTDYTNLRSYLIRVNQDKHIEDITNLFIIPDALIKLTDLTSHTAYNGLRDSQTAVAFTWYTLDYSRVPTTFNNTITKRTSFTGITVKNNKCFTYPYNYLFVTNNNGSSNIYKYEDFTSSNCVFENQIALTIGCSGRIVPKDYKNIPMNYDEALALGKYPTCAWSSDAFTNWLTQNGVNLAVNLGVMVGALALARSYRRW